ncbi:acyltransferase family protein [Pseudomonas sp. NPDC089534]|uniref:acyltransferase family protein n=1 Tax=Pseudomonas sp. NPDC089534 TaxID=3364468 RepID=UPI0038308171
MDMHKQEVRALTGLRGIAAMMVMLYHFNAGSLLEGRLGNFMGNGYLMVDLFLVLSGFVLTLSYGHLFEHSLKPTDILRFLYRRLSRIYPLYAVMTLTASLLVANSLMDRWPGPPVAVSALVNLTMFQTLFNVPTLDTPGWSVSAEWIASLCFPFIVLALLRRSGAANLLAMSGALAMLPLIAISPALFDEPKRSGFLDIWHYGTPYPVIRCLADFVMGVIAYRALEFAWLRRWLGHPGVAGAICVTTVWLMTEKGLDVLAVACFPLLILALQSGRHPAARLIGAAPFHWLGVISYSIYLVHNQLNYFMHDLADSLLRHGFTAVQAKASSIAAFAGLAVLIARLSYLLIERPALLALRNTRLSRPVPASS